MNSPSGQMPLPLVVAASYGAGALSSASCEHPEQCIRCEQLIIVSRTEGRQMAAAYQCFLPALLLPYPGIAARLHSSYFVISAVCAREV